MEKRGKILSKKGISPVVATVLLIAIVMVISLIIFVWFKNLTQEAITKFEGKNIELVCDDVDFSASYSSGELFISNDGTIPIFDMNLKISEGGDYSTEKISELNLGVWPSSGLNPGSAFSGDISGSIGNANQITVIPVLVGESSDGEKSFACDEKKTGYEIEIN